MNNQGASNRSSSEDFELVMRLLIANRQSVHFSLYLPVPESPQCAFF